MYSMTTQHALPHLTVEQKQNIARIVLQKNEANQKLHSAAKEGSVEDIINLIAKGANIEFTNNLRETPLHIAAKEGCVLAIEALIGLQANIKALDKDGKTALYLAAKSGHITVIEKLIESGASVNQYNEYQEPMGHQYVGIQEHPYGGIPIQIAAEQGHADVVTLLLTRGANPNPSTCFSDLDSSPLVYAVRSGSVEAVNALIQYGAKLKGSVSRYTGDFRSVSSTLLHLAVQQGSVEVIQALIKAGVQVDGFETGGSTPLYYAAINSKIEIVKLLKKHGAKTDAVDAQGLTFLHILAHHKKIETIKSLKALEFNLEEKGTGGFTALHYAAAFGKIEAIKALIEAGANIKATDEHGETPLHYAAQHGQIEAIRQLIAFADVNDKADSEWGRAPIHMAVANQKVEAIKVLLELGADPNLPNKNGLTTLQSSVDKGNVEAVKALVKGGAKLNLEAINEEAIMHSIIARRVIKEARIEDDSSLTPEVLKEAFIAFLNTETTETAEVLKEVIIACSNIKTIKHFITALRVMEEARIGDDSTLTPEILEAIIAFSNTEGSADIVIKRARIADKEAGENKYIEILKAAATIISKAIASNSSGEAPLEHLNNVSKALISEIKVVNDKYMVIAEALGNIITGKPMDLGFVNDLHHQLTSKDETQIKEANEALEELPFVRSIYNLCYGEGRGIDYKDLDYYKMVAGILSGTLKFERDGTELSLSEVLEKITVNEEGVQIFIQLEQATDKATLTDPLKNLIETLKADYLIEPLLVPSFLGASYTGGGSWFYALALDYVAHEHAAGGVAAPLHQVSRDNTTMFYRDGGEVSEKQALGALAASAELAAQSDHPSLGGNKRSREAAKELEDKGLEEALLSVALFRSAESAKIAAEPDDPDMPALEEVGAQETFAGVLGDSMTYSMPN